MCMQLCLLSIDVDVMTMKGDLFIDAELLSTFGGGSNGKLPPLMYSVQINQALGLDHTFSCEQPSSKQLLDLACVRPLIQPVL